MPGPATRSPYYQRAQHRLPKSNLFLRNLAKDAADFSTHVAAIMWQTHDSCH